MPGLPGGTYPLFVGSPMPLPYALGAGIRPGISGGAGRITLRDGADYYALGDEWLITRDYRSWRPSDAPPATTPRGRETTNSGPSDATGAGGGRVGMPSTPSAGRRWRPCGSPSGRMEPRQRCRESDRDGDQDLPVLRRGRQAGGDQMQALRDLAGDPARAGAERVRPGLGLTSTLIRQ